MKTAQKPAFTLIELLVVIVIIMVLATLLFPALQKTLESGRNAKCQSNLRQLQLASLNYATDNQFLPLSGSRWNNDGTGNMTHFHGWLAWYDYFGTSDGPRSDSPADGRYAWRGTLGMACITNGSLWSYAHNSAEVYICPTFVMKSTCNEPDAQWSYGMNLGASGANIYGLEGATTMLFADSSILSNSPASTTQNPISQIATNEVGAWHIKGKMRGGNVVYYDGHVERR